MSQSQKLPKSHVAEKLFSDSRIVNTSRQAWRR